MRIDTKILEDLAYDLYGGDEFEVVERIEEGSVGRWETGETMIIHNKKTNKHFSLFWTKGATEQQEHDCFEYEGDTMKVKEVVQVMVTVASWELAENEAT